MTGRMGELLFRVEGDEPDAWRTDGPHEAWFVEWLALACSTGQWSPVEGRRVVALRVVTAAEGWA